MKKAIAYSIFGYNDKHEGCLDFRSYMRGLEINIRVAELLYPGWQVFVTTDKETYNGLQSYFDYHGTSGKLVVKIIDKQPLCLMMLQRLNPIFEGFDRVICRDSDSLLSYRERQAVQYWEDGTKVAHAITDSVSHSIPIMGGMCGFVSGPFRDRLQVNSLQELVSKDTSINYHIKGADQTFLNRIVLPQVADSITEHFVLGHPQSFRGDCHNTIQDIDLGLPDVYKETNGFAFHIGAAGFQTDHTIRFLKEHGKDNEYYEIIEKQFPETFYWCL